MQLIDDFKEVKARVDIVSEIESRTGLRTKKVGKDFDLETCPFCAGHGCFRIDPDAKLYNCFQCSGQSGGDVISFVQKHKRCTNEEALQDLALSCGYELSRGKTGEGHPQADLDEGSSSYPVFNAAAEYYHQTLLKTESALRYQNRTRGHGLKTLKAFQVGFSDGKLNEKLAASGLSSDQMLASGLVKERDGGGLRDFFAADLYIYPHVTEAGQIGHFTMKDPKKRLQYQLPNEFRVPGCLFYSMFAFKGKEIIIVEGENDALSVYGRGGYEGVVACNGQISREQIEFLVNWAPGKTIYCCFDNDPAGRGYRKKLEEALAEDCLPPRLGRILGEEIVQLRAVTLPSDKKDIDDFLRAESDGKQALSSLLQRAEPCLIPLRLALARYRSWCSDQDKTPSSNEIGEILFDYFRLKGKFFVDNETCYLFYEPRIYEIGNNIAFKSMLYKEAGLNYGHSTTKQVVEVLQARAYERGDHATAPGWIHTDFKNNTIYFNLCNERNELVKISPLKVEVIQNGVNPERILLRSSPKMELLHYLPDANIQEAISRLKEFLFDNLACENSNRYFIVARLLNTLLIQYTKARGLDKYSGSKGSAKTSAASMMTTLTYGSNFVTTGSAAADFSEATVSPLTVSDNLESDAVVGDKRDFLLVASTGIVKQKRKSGTDSQNVYERACTQTIITAIEPFLSGELIERSIDIHFHKSLFRDSFPESTEIEAKLVEHRDLIWSAFFKIIANDVLPCFNEKRTKALKMLRSTYRGHSKSRLNELYSCLFVLCEAILQYIPHPDYNRSDVAASAILAEWLSSQDAQSKETARGTDKILYRMEVLVKEYLADPDEFVKTYRLMAEHTKDEIGEILEIKFEFVASDLLFAFETLGKNRGISCPFNNPKHLGVRLIDGLDVIESSGWIFMPKKRTVRGVRHHWLVKKFGATEGV